MLLITGCGQLITEQFLLVAPVIMQRIQRWKAYFQPSSAVLGNKDGRRPYKKEYHTQQVWILYRPTCTCTFTCTCTCTYMVTQQNKKRQVLFSLAPTAQLPRDLHMIPSSISLSSGPHSLLFLGAPRWCCTAGLGRVSPRERRGGLEFGQGCADDPPRQAHVTYLSKTRKTE